MTSILSHSTEHYRPGGKAYYEHSSAGQIAQRLFALLSSYGNCRYCSLNDKPGGLTADLFIGVPENFKHVCQHNRIGRKIMLCSIAITDKELLSLCDAALFVGNKTTAKFFPPGFENKIHLANYGCNEQWFSRDAGVEQQNEFIHFVTEATPRKGFERVMTVWKGRPEKLHILGYMNDPAMQKLFKENNSGQMVHHGYVPNDTLAALKILKGCRFIYVPTEHEGQVGSVMEAMFGGLLALTTLESGLDERVLEHAFITQPADVEAQKRFVDQMLGMSNNEYLSRQRAMLSALQQYQTWESFEKAAHSLIKSI